jgi:predicted GH43/DUF377 family glycosyl hydrolase
MPTTSANAVTGEPMNGRSESPRGATVLTRDPSRVVTHPFLPREQVSPHGSTRMQKVLERIVEMPPREADIVLADALAWFAGRHRDLERILEQTYEVVAARFDHQLPVDLPVAHRHLIGAYFTQEHAIEAAALCNPSIVPAPDQHGVAPGAVRFVMSLRAIGEGHRSSIEFRSGTVDAGGVVVVDSPSGFATTATVTVDGTGYRADFDSGTELSERVLVPSGATESHGLEDARFVRFVDENGPSYLATYTAFDGHVIRPQLLETTDFCSFRAVALTGDAARNKGMALFPRKVGGRFMALGRHDNVNNYVLATDDLHEWPEARLLQEPQRPWELMQLGNCGSPLETEAGWLVITHGVGPFRTYRLGALLLDLDDPTKVIGHLADPLLEPVDHERDGYVPNVVYSCGAMIHAGHLVLPYGFGDIGARIVVIELADLLSRLT